MISKSRANVGVDEEQLNSKAKDKKRSKVEVKNRMKKAQNDGCCHH